MATEQGIYLYNDVRPLACNYNQSVIECYVHGELSEFEKRRLEVHFKSCQKCATVRSEIETLYSLFRKNEPSRLNKRIQENEKIKISLVEAVQSEIHREKINRKKMFMYVSAATILLMVTALFTIWRHFDNYSKPLKTIWVHNGIRSFKTGYFHTPVVYRNMVFAVKAGTTEDHVIAVDAHKGTEIWESDVASSGRITTDGERVYTVGKMNYETYLAALDYTTGKTVWIYNYGTNAVDFAVTSPLSANHKILWCTGQEIIILDSRTGILEKSQKCLRSSMAAKPVIVEDRLYGTLDNSLICMDISTDTLLWQTVIDEELSTFIRPVISVYNNEIYIAGKCSNGRAVTGCFDIKSGKIQWKKNDIPAFHVYAINGAVVFRAGSIIAVNSKGKLLWEKSSPGCSPLTVHGNTALYFDASDHGGLIAIDLKNGKEMSRFDTGNNCTGVMISDDIGLLCTNDGILKAFYSQDNLKFN